MQYATVASEVAAEVAEVALAEEEVLKMIIHSRQMVKETLRGRPTARCTLLQEVP